MNKTILVISTTILGFLLSTAIALSNGYSPANIYGGTTPGILDKIKEQLEQARQINDQLRKINAEKTQIIKDLKQDLASLSNTNDAMKNSLKSIATIIHEGENDGEKLRKIANKLNDIGNQLIYLSHSPTP